MEHLWKVVFLIVLFVFVPRWLWSQETKTKLALLKYKGGGDWYANPTSLPNLIRFCNDKLGTDLATLGITGLSLPRVHIDGVVWHLDVGSSHPGAVVGPKGWAVRPLKRYASWVQNVVRQFGPYPAWA